MSKSHGFIVTATVWLTIVILAVSFLTIDDVETIRHAGHHAADFKIEPLRVCRGVDISIENQIIFMTKRECERQTDRRKSDEVVVRENRRDVIRERLRNVLRK